MCAVVLAGGQATRMGGVDKGLQSYRGKTLVQTALERLRQQSAGSPGLLAINANRHQAEYAALGVPVWGDTVPGFIGPLAGFLVAMQHSLGRFDYVLSVPCDSPRFPLDLLQRLSNALLAEQAEIAMALAPDVPLSGSAADHSTARGRSAEGNAVLRPQPVFCLMRSNLGASLQQFVADGGRKIGAWTASHRQVRVPFNAVSDDPRAFANANTLDELHALEQP